MTNSILEKDIDLHFPHFLLLKASAGSGKTHTLTQRYVQFLLSEKIPQNHLPNILAITFSNNAAKEMKARILTWLKGVYFQIPDKLRQISSCLSLNQKQLVSRAEALIDEIILNYTDFQVKTIDSFMTSIYKASAIDLGYSPDFEILLTPKPVITYAFNRFFRKVRANSREDYFLEQILTTISEDRGKESAYLWDPAKVIEEEITSLYRKLSGIVKPVDKESKGEEVEDLKEKIANTATKLERIIKESNFKRNEKSSFSKILKLIKLSHYSDLIGKGLKTPPVIKPKNSKTNPTYREILQLWEELGKQIRNYSEIYSFNYYRPYLKVYPAFQEVLEQTKKEEGFVFIEDINKKLSDYLKEEIIPDIYFRIGETVFHYLVDEFQDTSPIQWVNLYPLIENSLAQGGSFFAVGDTKQAIYGFRDADYRIMRALETSNPFLPATYAVKELPINYRSLERIVKFTEEFFQGVVRAYDEYKEAAEKSGLVDYQQDIKEEYQGLGYVEVKIYKKNKKEEEFPEKQELQNRIKELKKRGYNYSDLAVLTLKNEDVVNFTTWLNEISVPFISYSNLDIRTRKLTGEILSLLKFLDSPPDNLSFSTFLLGDILRAALNQNGEVLPAKKLHEFLFRNRKENSLYKIFQQEFPEVWENYFARLFKLTGYLPLYDLVSEIYWVFKILENFKNEEATLIKILEVIKDFESEGMNNPADFLRLAADDNLGEVRWNIDVPEGIEAVKLMTIHKAKGLEFPVVILILYGEQSRGFRYLLAEKEKEVYLLKVNRNIAAASEFLRATYEEEKIKELVNQLNTLYVGFTRAESELYVIGVGGEKKQFPIDLLEKTKPVWGEKRPPQKPTKIINPPLFPLSYSSQPVDFSSFTTVEEIKIEERRRGEFIHRVLAFIEYLNDGWELELEKRVREIVQETNIDYPIAEIKKEILEFISQEEIRPYFVWQPGRMVLREQDFSDSEGNLLRMDRVIVDENRVTVIDYKTGLEKTEEEKYLSQVRNYRKILQNLYPNKKVEGVIAYFDRKEVTKIN